MSNAAPHRQTEIDALASATAEHLEAVRLNERDELRRASIDADASLLRDRIETRYSTLLAEEERIKAGDYPRHHALDGPSPDDVAVAERAAADRRQQLRDRKARARSRGRVDPLLAVAYARWATSKLRARRVRRAADRINAITADHKAQAAANPALDEAWRRKALADARRRYEADTSADRELLGRLNRTRQPPNAHPPKGADVMTVNDHDRATAAGRIRVRRHTRRRRR